MIDTAEWSKDIYEAGVASRCWRYTPYDAGWDGAAPHDGADLPADDELRRIVAGVRPRLLHGGAAAQARDGGLRCEDPWAEAAGAGKWWRSGSSDAHKV